MAKMDQVKHDTVWDDMGGHYQTLKSLLSVDAVFCCRWRSCKVWHVAYLSSVVLLFVKVTNLIFICRPQITF